MALARRAVESGLLGKVASARVELNWYRPQSYYKNWHGKWDGEGGGAAFHHGRYIIDPFLWVLGSRVEEVFAFAGPQLRDIEHENLTQAAVRYANGATGTVHASLLNHKQQLTPAGRFEVLGHDASMLVGEEYNHGLSPGANAWEAETTFGSADNPGAVEALEGLSDQVAGVPEHASEEYQSRLFLESIVNEEEPLVPIDVPMHHVELVRAMYKSAHEGAPVTLPLDKNDPFYSFEGRI
jgi:predicted dehydrogenase